MATASPPPTPPRERPDLKNWRFETGCCYEAEEVESYRPGGLHPVHLGDFIADGRFRILRKLGYGSFSTVWLAVNVKNAAPKYVAIKIEHASRDHAEALFSLDGSAPLQLPNERFVNIVESFVIHGPNGKHVCSVFPPMGPTITTMLSDRLDILFKEGRARHGAERFPKAMAKRILKQMLQGLNALHKSGMVHGDVHPGNFFFSIRDIADEPEYEMRRDADKKIRPIIRKDGKADPWAPRYLTLSQPLSEFVDEENFTIKLGDFADSWPTASNPPEKLLMPIALRAPEIVLERREMITEKIDIWSFGCLLFELLAGTKLFWIDKSFEYVYDRWDWKLAYDSLVEFHDVLGHDPPETVISADVPFGKMWLEANGKRKRCQSRGFDEEWDGKVYERGEYPEDRKVLRCSLEERWAGMKPDDFDEEETKVVLGLIRKILKWDPSVRPSAEDLLKEDWFADV